MVDAIKPRPDIKDYYGNLPIFYSLQRNDVEMVERLFKKGRDYFNIRNYKNESIFHVAAKHKALDALKVLIDERPFGDELLKKDYLGNTPIHVAAKREHGQILEYFSEAAKRLDIQNDFGITANS